MPKSKETDQAQDQASQPTQPTQPSQPSLEYVWDKVQILATLDQRVVQLERRVIALEASLNPAKPAPAASAPSHDHPRLAGPGKRIKFFASTAEAQSEPSEKTEKK